MSIQPVSPTWQRALLLPLSILAWLAVVVVVFWLLGHVTRALLLLVLASVVAFAVTPLITVLGRWMPRNLAIAVAYILAFLIVFGLIGLVVLTAISQTSSLVGSLPRYVEQAGEIKPRLLVLFGPLGLTADQVDRAQAGLVGNLESFGSRAASDALGVVSGILNALIDTVLVLILSIYLAANGPRMQAWLRGQTPQLHRRRTRLIIAIVNRVVGGYIRGQLALAALVGVLVGLSMAVFQVRYAILLGVLAFFMEFVPILGVFISGAICLFVALFQGWITSVEVVVAFVVIHVIEGDVVGPRIMGRAVGVHPAMALVALVAGTELFGIWGALFGAPLAGLVQAVIVAAWREVRQARADQVAVAAVANPPPPARPPRRRANSP